MSPQPITENTLFYGDNLKVLREYIATESIDLIYLDPPFNSSRSYNVLFKDESGTGSEAQITAFEDTWHWNQAAEQTYRELVTQSPDHISKMIAALRDFIGANQMTAYLVMMTIRLVELHRVLKSTGSLYLHCDQTASHYLKVILDTIFDPHNFRNEITWKRTSAHNDPKRYGRNTDTILYYSKTGDFVLDPFCGCGTAIAAAQKLGRKWIGIDITYLAIALMKYRLEGMFSGIHIDVKCEPEDIGGARQLAHDDRYQFQWWALSLIRAKPQGGQEGSKTGKKGSDKGIDGVITFIDDAYNKPKRVIVQVKSGHVKSGDIRDLIGTVEQEKAAIGVFITLETPTRDMLSTAISAGFYHSPGWNKDYPRIQIITIDDLLQHRAEVQMPPQYGTFKQAQKVRESASEQPELKMQ
jgi:DNA modification methylase